jgi:hypothetical protein
MVMFWVLKNLSSFPLSITMCTAVVLQLWLTGFLGVVGLMKGYGKLLHPLVSLIDKRCENRSDFSLTILCLPGA